MQIVITGANGYIGSHVVKELLDSGHKVIAVDLNHSRIDKRSVIYNEDIFDESKNLYEEWGKPNVVIHLACKDVPVHNSMWHVDNIHKNFRFLKNLIDCGLKQVVTVGSMHDIGYYVGAIDENTIPNPQTFYGVSKDTLRRLMEIYTKGKNVVYQHLRFYYTYGDDEQSSGSIFSKILQMEKECMSTFPFTDGKNEFDYIKITELARQIRAVVEQKEIQGIINCCTGKPVSIKDMVERFIEEKHLKIKPDYGKYPTRPYDSPCVYGDASKIKTLMHNNPSCIICIPVYKPLLNEQESESLEQCIRIFHKHNISLFCPHNLNIEKYQEIFNKLNKTFTCERFSNKNFRNRDAYSKLLLSQYFYRRYIKYDYMLIYQLDAWVFRDELMYWCNKNYDYIGAPWKLDVLNKIVCFSPEHGGNGGFSLRKVSSFIELTNQGISDKDIYTQKSLSGIYKLKKKKKFISNFLNIPYFLFYWIMQKKLLGREIYNEDLIIAKYAKLFLPQFRFASRMDSSRFSIESFCEEFYQLNNNICRLALIIIGQTWIFGQKWLMNTRNVMF